MLVVDGQGRRPGGKHPAEALVLRVHRAEAGVLRRLPRRGRAPPRALEPGQHVGSVDALQGDDLGGRRGEAGIGLDLSRLVALVAEIVERALQAWNRDHAEADEDECGAYADRAHPDAVPPGFAAYDVRKCDRRLE